MKGVPSFRLHSVTDWSLKVQYRLQTLKVLLDMLMANLWGKPLLQWRKIWLIRGPVGSLTHLYLSLYERVYTREKVLQCTLRKMESKRRGQAVRTVFTYDGGCLFVLKDYWWIYTTKKAAYSQEKATSIPSDGWAWLKGCNHSMPSLKYFLP